MGDGSDDDDDDEEKKDNENRSQSKLSEDSGCSWGMGMFCCNCVCCVVILNHLVWKYLWELLTSLLPELHICVSAADEVFPEEDENEENPFSTEFQEDQEAAYLKDPKKALQGFYDREGKNTSNIYFIH